MGDIDMNLLGNHFIGGLILTNNDRRFRAEHPLSKPVMTAPEAFDNRGWVTRTEDQGNTPQCVAYSMTSLIESVTWARTHRVVQLDPGPLYATAKRIDGEPDEDGTDFVSAFKAAIEIGYIPADSKAYGLNDLEDVRFAVHEYTLCLIGLDVTEAWGKATADGWVQDNGGDVLGGHAVLACGWNLLPGAVDWVGWKNSWGQWGSAGFGRMRVDQFNKRFLGGLAVEIPDMPGKGW